MFYHTIPDYRSFLLLLFLGLLPGATNLYGQPTFSESPEQAQFVSEDVDRFWEAFDNIDTSTDNPFENYIKNGTPGLKGFTRYRIINADSLYAMVRRNPEKYQATRDVLATLPQQAEEIRAIYTALEAYYPEAVYPPVYFVIGRFNSGGTVSKDGIIIGAEKLTEVDLLALVAHELVHFQQRIKGRNTILRQAISEGGADFIGELISGKNINTKVYTYANAHREALCREFARDLKKKDYIDWFYGTSGKDDRPNDLGYWMGYQITKAYYDQQEDKKQAIADILNVKKPTWFLKASGYLDGYWQK